MHIVITFPYALGVAGGGPLDCTETAKHLRQAGADVTVLPINCHTVSRFPRPHTPDELLGADVIAELREHDVRVVAVSQNPVHYLLDGLSVRNTILDLMKSTQIDAVLSWHQEAAFLPRFLQSRGVLFGMFASNGYFAEWYNDCDRLRKFIRTQTVVKPLRQADVVLARSEFMRDLIIDVFNLEPEKIEVAHCGVNQDFMQIERASRRKISRFLFFGWLIREKGVFDTLEALARVHESGNSDWTLKVIGWGDVEGVRRKAKDYGIEENVVILERLPRPQLMRELEWADLAILPSHGESFGLANAESQAAGLPVIAYDVGGVPEIVVNGETGWLAPIRDVRKLTDTVKAAIQNPEDTFDKGLAGRERVRELFSWSRSAEITLKRIEELKMSQSNGVPKAHQSDKQHKSAIAST